LTFSGLNLIGKAIKGNRIFYGTAASNVLFGLTNCLVLVEIQRKGAKPAMPSSDRQWAIGFTLNDMAAIMYRKDGEKVSPVLRPDKQAFT